MATIFFGDEVNFMTLIFYLQKNIRTLDRHGAIFLYLFGAFVFWAINRGHTMLLGIVMTIRLVQKRMPIIIMETIMCLDRIPHHPHLIFSDSTLLLQGVFMPIRLCEAEWVSSLPPQFFKTLLSLSLFRFFWVEEPSRYHFCDLLTFLLFLFVFFYYCSVSCTDLAMRASTIEGILRNVDT